MATSTTRTSSTTISKDVPPVFGRTSSGGFKTGDGTLYVSKPFRSRTSKKLRAMVAFTPRTSAFDISNERSGANEFRGFFTLFWISIFLLMVRTYVRSHEEHGYFLPFAFARKISQDAITLAISDFILVASTGLCVPFAQAVAKGRVRYYWTGVIIQHMLQAILLGIAITWTFNRHWPWVQSGFLTLHSLVMIMKMHSYMSVNGFLQSVNSEARSALAELHRLATVENGGWDSAIAAAQTNRAELNAKAGSSNSSSFEDFGAFTPAENQSATSTPALGTTKTDADGSTKSYIDAKAAVVLRQRLIAATEGTRRPEPERFESMSNPTPPLPTGTTHPHTHLTDPAPGAPGLHPLVDHPSEQIATIAREYSEMEAELTSSGPLYVRWPDNIGWKNFAVYQLIPTLVYELEYPRTDRIRPLYIFEKTVATFGTFALLYSVTESFILPLTPTSDQSFLRSLLDLALPFMVAYLLLFYLIFECICNAFAELSYFADRQFYEDWPVHTFLLRHVYASTISSYHISRGSAMFLTFLLSACVHELVMAVVTQKIRMYLFAMQLVQIPLIAVGRIPAIKRNKLMGNVVFWVGLYAGFPLLCVAYCAY